MSEISTKPYFIRAIFEWCCDSGFTPYINVRVDGSTRVPMEYVKEGEIVLNISTGATRNLTIDSSGVQFTARFNGTSREISVPISNIAGIFARENGQGMMFPPEAAVTPVAADSVPRLSVTEKAEANPADFAGSHQPKPSGAAGKNHLKVVK